LFVPFVNNSGIASKYTSFVGVAEDEGGENRRPRMIKKVVIPSMIPFGMVEKKEWSVRMNYQKGPIYTCGGGGGGAPYKRLAAIKAKKVTQPQEPVITPDSPENKSLKLLSLQNSNGTQMSLCNRQVAKKSCGYLHHRSVDHFGSSREPVINLNSPENKLLKLLSLQSSKGTYKMTEEFCSLLGLDLGTIRNCE